jgi:phosphatidylglycerol lysyltransferase
MPARTEPTADHRDVERARALVLQHGWNAIAYQIVNVGISHWFAAAGDAVVGYVRTHRVCVVAGAPVCAADRLSAVLDEWEHFAASRGCRVCYFGAAGDAMASLQESRGHTGVPLGAQPVWHPTEWSAMVQTHASVRALLHRARNKGVRVSEWTRGRATSSPLLLRCLQQWLDGRGLPPLHFLVEPFTLHDLTHRRIFVAELGEHAVGFVVASPVPARNGWLIEQFVRGTQAPNGTIELLLDHAMRTLADAGATYVTLGLVPLRPTPEDIRTPPPLWLALLLRWMRAHGNRFYNFRGLDTFKTKFRPSSWEPIHAIVTAPVVTPPIMYAIAAAFTRQSPWRTGAIGLGRALRSEWFRLVARR